MFYEKSLNSFFISPICGIHAYARRLCVYLCGMLLSNIYQDIMFIN